MSIVSCHLTRTQGSISSVEEPEDEVARAVTPAAINTGAFRKNFGIYSRDNRTPNKSKSDRWFGTWGL